MKNNLDKIIVMGDKVLIQPGLATECTNSGLFLPAGYHEKEDIASGYVVKCGPGYALPRVEDDEWSQPAEAKYLPLQVKPGDWALFLHKHAIDIKYNGEKFFIVPQNAILLVERDEL